VRARIERNERYIANNAARRAKVESENATLAQRTANEAALHDAIDHEYNGIYRYSFYTIIPYQVHMNVSMIGIYGAMHGAAGRAARHRAAAASALFGAHTVPSHPPSATSLPPPVLPFVPAASSADRRS
jgi:hypothetical protein